MNKLFIYVFMSLAILGMASAVCTYDYNKADASDYFGINVNTVNVTEMTSTQLWTAWNYFTPRLNFTRVVNGSIVGTNENLTGATQTWVIRDNNCNTTLKIYNGTTLLGAGNYSFVWINQSNHTWAFKFLTQTYAGEIMRWSCNRTFVACKVNMTAPADCDDLVVANRSIESQYTLETWIAENEPVNYGDNKEFRFEDSFLGAYVNNTNWAVGWNYTEVTCSVGDTGCSAGATGLWGILVLVVVAGFLFYLTTVFFEGNITVGIIVYVAIVAALIPFLIDILNLGC